MDRDGLSIFVDLCEPIKHTYCPSPHKFDIFFLNARVSQCIVRIIYSSILPEKFFRISINTIIELFFRAGYIYHTTPVHFSIREFSARAFFITRIGTRAFFYYTNCACIRDH